MGIEKWTLEDGRRAEKRVVETNDGRTTELHVEDVRPLKLQQRIIEKTKPVVYERETHVIDALTGEITEKTVESLEPRVPMQVVDRIVLNNQVEAQSVENDCDCHVTKEEMIDTIVAAIKATKQEPVKVVVPANQFVNRLNSLGLADEIADRVDVSGYSTMDKVCAVAGAILVGVIFYILFVMV